MMNRRTFLTSCIATVAAPMVIPYSHLMPLSVPKVMRYNYHVLPCNWVSVAFDSINFVVVDPGEKFFLSQDGVTWSGDLQKPRVLVL